MAAKTPLFEWTDREREFMGEVSRSKSPLPSFGTRYRRAMQRGKPNP